MKSKNIVIILVLLAVAAALFVVSGDKSKQISANQSRAEEMKTYVEENYKGDGFKDLVEATYAPFLKEFEQELLEIEGMEDHHELGPMLEQVKGIYAQETVIKLSYDAIETSGEAEFAVIKLVKPKIGFEMLVEGEEYKSISEYDFITVKESSEEKGLYRFISGSAKSYANQKPMNFGEMIAAGMKDEPIPTTDGMHLQSSITYGENYNDFWVDENMRAMKSEYMLKDASVSFGESEVELFSMGDTTAYWESEKLNGKETILKLTVKDLKLGDAFKMMVSDKFAHFDIEMDMQASGDGFFKALFSFVKFQEDNMDYSMNEFGCSIKESDAKTETFGEIEGFEEPGCIENMKEPQFPALTTHIKLNEYKASFKDSFAVNVVGEIDFSKSFEFDGTMIPSLDLKHTIFDYKAFIDSVSSFIPGGDAAMMEEGMSEVYNIGAKNAVIEIKMNKENGVTINGKTPDEIGK